MVAFAAGREAAIVGITQCNVGRNRTARNVAREQKCHVEFPVDDMASLGVALPLRLGMGWNRKAVISDADHDVGTRSPCGALAVNIR